LVKCILKYGEGFDFSIKNMNKIGYFKYHNINSNILDRKDQNAIEIRKILLDHKSKLII